ncbi:uncharacterized protein LOC132578315 [Heteronotia binoei]|uniref:uncharacterized protein LOC132578315 n=1 Tax=Heteronotia binoei TaxID=13085 RepID=UPI00292FD036|nr:uncharacterized protein LOC132578315 [Heteronotia binoei]
MPLGTFASFWCHFLEAEYRGSLMPCFPCPLGDRQPYPGVFRIAKRPCSGVSTFRIAKRPCSALHEIPSLHPARLPRGLSRGLRVASAPGSPPSSPSGPHCKPHPAAAKGQGRRLPTTRRSEALPQAPWPQSPRWVRGRHGSFLQEELEMLEKRQQELYFEVLMENYESLIAIGNPVTISDVIAWFKQDERQNCTESQDSRAGDSSANGGFERYTETPEPPKIVDGSFEEEMTENDNLWGNPEGLIVHFTHQGSPRGKRVHSTPGKGRRWIGKLHPFPGRSRKRQSHMTVRGVAISCG